MEWGQPPESGCAQGSCPHARSQITALRGHTRNQCAEQGSDPMPGLSLGLNPKCASGMGLDPNLICGMGAAPRAWLRSRVLPPRALSDYGDEGAGTPEISVLSKGPTRC